MSKVGVLASRLSEESCRLLEFVRPGLQALSKPARNCVRLESRKEATDSLSFDDLENHSPTFDYLIGARPAHPSVLAFEVHPANAREVEIIIRKQSETRAKLVDCKCGACRIDIWIWVASGNVDLPPTSPKRKLLATQGILGPRGIVDLRALPK